jgi:hypothetical protein
MKQQVTVVPEDHIIIVDRSVVTCEFSIPDNIHAIQWKSGHGEIEFTDQPNVAFTSQDYETWVLPYVIIHAAEVQRRISEEQEAERKRLEYMQRPENLAQTIREERDRRLSNSDKYVLIDFPSTEEQKIAWMTYREQLRDMTRLEGFPWNGVEDAPWPVEPA